MQRTPTRLPEMSDGAPWAAKLREAEDEARLLLQNPLATDDERKQMWATCQRLIQDAQTLLRTDDNYLPQDAINMVVATLNNCRQLVDQTRNERNSAIPKSVMRGSWAPDLQTDLTTLGLPPDLDVNKTLDAYAEQVYATRRILRAAGLA